MSEQIESGWRKAVSELKRLSDNSRRRKITLKKSAAVDGGSVKVEKEKKNAK